MAENGEIKFQNPDIFAGDTGVVDRANAIIRGVSVITGDLIAEGHDLHVDSTTLQQLQACAKERGKIPVSLDHGSGIKDIDGYLTSFRMDGNKLRADWHLLKSHDQTPTMLERAELMPGCFGMSTAFKGPPKGVPTGGGRMAARCEKLLSVDCVTRPAANEGLFSIPEVDNKQKSMAKKTGEVKLDEEGNEPTLAQVLEAVKSLSGRLDEHDQFNQELVSHLQGQGQEQEQGEPTLEDFANATDEQLAEYNKASGTNITREDINAAVSEAMAGQEGSEGEQGGEEGAAVGAGAEGGAEYSPAGANSVGSEFAALKKEISKLTKKQEMVELQAKKDAEEIELSQIEEKVLVLANQRDKAIELAENYKAENDALRLAVRTGTRPVMAGVDTGLRMFSANGEGQLHEFQVRVKQISEGGKTEAQAIRLAQKENPGLHADWVQSLRKQPA